MKTENADQHRFPTLLLGCNGQVKQTKINILKENRRLDRVSKLNLKFKPAGKDVHSIRAPVFSYLLKDKLSKNAKRNKIETKKQ